jgi:hypothetical protein
MPIPKDLNGNPHATFNIGLHDKQIKVDFKPLDSYPLGKSLLQMRFELTEQDDSIRPDQDSSFQQADPYGEWTGVLFQIPKQTVRHAMFYRA